MNKNNIILIIVLIALVIVFFALRQAKDQTERRISFFSIDLDKLGAVEISTARDTLRLASVDFQWSIEKPFLFPVNNNRMDRFFNEVLPVQTSSIAVSENKDAYEDYQVTEEKGTLVTLYDKNNNILDSAIVGQTRGFAYARRPADNRIYQLYDNISTVIRPTLNPWRSNEVVSIPSSHIKNVQISYEGNDYELAATDTVWTYSNANTSFEVEDSNQALTNILSTLGKLESFTFIDFKFDEYAEHFAEPRLSVTINKTNNTSTYLVFAAEADDRYLLMKDNIQDHLYRTNAEVLNKFTISEQRFTE